MTAYWWLLLALVFEIGLSAIVIAMAVRQLVDEIHDMSVEIRHLRISIEDWK
jgi:hypothetical protein